jgi:hypothetical protein
MASEDGKETDVVRNALPLVLLSAALAACGSTTKQPAPVRPKLDATLAETLAARSDAVAEALDAGDSCRASTLVQDLQRQTISAINARRVPASLQEPLQAAVNDLAARIRCVPPPQDEDKKDKHRGKHGKKRKHHGESD